MTVIEFTVLGLSARLRHVFGSIWRLTLLTCYKDMKLADAIAATDGLSVSEVIRVDDSMSVLTMAIDGEMSSDSVVDNISDSLSYVFNADVSIRRLLEY